MTMKKNNYNRWRTAKEHEHRKIIAEFCRGSKIGG